MGTQHAYGTKTSIQIEAIWCNSCGIPYGLPEGFLDDRRKDHKEWTCPNGCRRWYPPGESAEQKLKKAAARETALKDQLAAAVHDAEDARVALLRDRQRVANGVCPCCNRSFENVRQHMTTQHPEYRKNLTMTPAYRCSCGRRFESFRGLRTHQGWSRQDGWDAPKNKWRAHLTKV